jgi:hypothetical protein
MTTPVSYVELNSPDLEATTAFVRVVEAFSMPGVGRGCYVTDPAGLHEYDADAT